eukprot:TRINITY_DN2500_c0_g2_i8.p1 TRINITY_DN2500_c0_g2~~TRINITY_DN2500_c0_g2_i8.p1  ORF type:complete len:406 (+),score=34.97 TRINITY_DN2500_c0_g2_i8:94-1311(+)
MVFLLLLLCWVSGTLTDICTESGLLQATQGFAGSVQSFVTALTVAHKTAAKNLVESIKENFFFTVSNSDIYLPFDNLTKAQIQDTLPSDQRLNRTVEIFVGEKYMVEVSPLHPQVNVNTSVLTLKDTCEYLWPKVQNWPPFCRELDRWNNSNARIMYEFSKSMGTIIKILWNTSSFPITGFWFAGCVGFTSAYFPLLRTPLYNLSRPSTYNDFAETFYGTLQNPTNKALSGPYFNPQRQLVYSPPYLSAIAGIGWNMATLWPIYWEDGYLGTTGLTLALNRQQQLFQTKVSEGSHWAVILISGTIVLGPLDFFHFLWNDDLQHKTSITQSNAERNNFSGLFFCLDTKYHVPIPCQLLNPYGIISTNFISCLFYVMVGEKNDHLIHELPESKETVESHSSVVHELM